MKKKFWLALVSVLFTATTIKAGLLLLPSFEGAPAGTALSFTAVPLPPVSETVASASIVIPPQAPGPLNPVPILRRVTLPNPWAPTIDQLLHGETIIESNAQMRDVWQRLFEEPYDASLFDFNSDFVLLMGNGLMNLGSFNISHVERVEADYDDPIGGLPVTNAFLSVTATVFLPGVPPKKREDPTYRVSAARVPNAHRGDAIFHTSLFAAP